MKYIDKFDRPENVQEALYAEKLLKPYLAKVVSGDYIDYNSQNIDFTTQYFCIEILDEGITTITTNFDFEATPLTSNYWQQYSANTENWLGRGIIKIRATNDSSTGGSLSFSVNGGRFNVFGNIMSLIYSDNFIGQTTLPRPSIFYAMFTRNLGLISAKNLILPATTLGEYCYTYMFDECTSLVTAPQLPATTLAEYCYYSMFSNCTSLTTAPQLPATTLAEACYQSMFRNCTSLVHFPDTNFGYGISEYTVRMDYITELARNCCTSMFRGCTTLQNAFLPSIEQNTSFWNYNNTFYGCTSLKHIVCLQNFYDGSQTQNWTYGVASTGVFVKKTGVNWDTGVSGIPEGWTVYESINNY